MNKELLLELAAKCEAAQGPDRELDLAIGFAALGWRWGEDGFGGEYLNFGAPNAVAWRQAIDPVPACVPSPTASLDAVMTLVDDQLVTIVMREALDRLDAVFNPMDNYLVKLRLFVLAASLRSLANQED